jgi:hypothetical protein
MGGVEKTEKRKLNWELRNTFATPLPPPFTRVFWVIFGDCK